VRDRDDVDLIYVNDNYGDLSATREALVRQIVDGARPDLMKPFIHETDWPIMAKVHHSAVSDAAELPPDPAGNQSGSSSRVRSPNSASATARWTPTSATTR
jgi:hypothetical protein